MLIAHTVFLVLLLFHYVFNVPINNQATHKSQLTSSLASSSQETFHQRDTLLRQRSTPSSPPKPVTLHINISSINITWEYPPTIPPTQFIVKGLSNAFNSSGFVNITKTLINDTYYIYTNLMFGCYYEFTVTAYQDGMFSDPSHHSTLFENGGTAPPGPPQSLSAYNITSTSISLIWNEPQPETELKYLYHVYKGEHSNDLVQADTTQESTYTFRHLQSHTRYYFSVQADFGGEKSILSPVISAVTSISYLSPVTILNISTNYTMATLWWSAPNVTYSILQKFTILYTLKIHLPSKPTVWNDPSLYESLDVSGTEKMGVVNGLEQDMVYVFRVQYEADEVMSNLSTISQAKTLSSLQCLSCSTISSTKLALKLKVFNPEARQQVFIANYSTSIISSMNSSKSSLSFVVSDLHPWTAYFFSVAINNSYGMLTQTTKCPVDNCRTNEDKPSGAPMDLQGYSLNSTSIHLKWSPVELGKQNGIILYYLIACTNCPSKQIRVTQTSLNITGLNPNAVYYFQVSAVNSKGNGPLSDFIAVKTMDGVPVGSPQNITLLELTSSYMALSWLPPPISQQNGDIVLYTVEYYKTPLLTDKENIIWNDKNSKTKTSLRNTHKEILLLREDLVTNISQYVNTSSQNITLTNLSTDTTYTVQVFAWTTNGHGPPSSPQVFKTTKLPSSDPINIKNFTALLIDQSFEKCFCVKLNWYTDIYDTSTTKLLKYNLTYKTGNTSSSVEVTANTTSYEFSSKILKSNKNYTFILDAIVSLDSNQTISRESCYVKTPHCTGVITVVSVVVILFFVVIISTIIMGVVYWQYRKCSKKQNRHRNYSMEQMIRHPVVENDYIITHMKEHRGDGQSSLTHSINSLDSTSNEPVDDLDSETNENSPFLVPNAPFTPALSYTSSPSSQDTLIYREDGYITHESFNDPNISSDKRYRLSPEGSSISSSTETDETEHG